MFNTCFRFILSITSIAPVTGAMALSIFCTDENKLCGLPWLGATIILPLVCYGCMKIVRDKKNVKDELIIKEFNRKDEGIIPFLFVSLLPFLKMPYPFFNGNLVVMFYIIVVIFMFIVNIQAYNFNPVMVFLGYKFYAVKDNEDAHHLLILKRNLTQSKKVISVNSISENVWIERKS